MEDIRWDNVKGLVNKEVIGETDGLFKLIFTDGVKSYGYVMNIHDVKRLKKIARFMQWEYFKICLRHPFRVKNSSLYS